MQIVQRSISTRLFLGMLLTLALVVSAMTLATRWQYQRGFLGYLNELAFERSVFLLPRLANAWRQHGNWDFLREDVGVWFELQRPLPGQEIPADADPGTMVRMLPSDLTGAGLRLGLLDSQLQWVVGYRDINGTLPRRPVQVDGQTVGWLVLAPFEEVADGAERRFLDGQTRSLALAAGLSLALAAGMGWWLSRRLSRPVHQLAGAFHRLAHGEQDVRVHAMGRDEIGVLADDFNRLAETLQRTEALKRDFVADVSHELRTPLAVLRGEIEALQDGVRPFTPEALESLRTEVGQLEQLVSDLYTLALGDAGALHHRLVPLDLTTLVRQVAEGSRHPMAEHGLVLWVSGDAPEARPGAGQADAREGAAGPAEAGQRQPAASSDGHAEALPVLGDAARLRQLLDNLLANCARYTDAPGQVRLTLSRQGPQAVLQVDDSPPGVPEDTLTRLFDRFYRVEGSRSRLSGGTGLGLSIARHIVGAHGGDITASGSPLGGVRMTLRLPLVASAIDVEASTDRLGQAAAPGTVASANASAAPTTPKRAAR